MVEAIVSRCVRAPIATASAIATRIRKHATASESERVVACAGVRRAPAIGPTLKALIERVSPSTVPPAMRT